jgi:histidyl-tRNA synthetase
MGDVVIGLILHELKLLPPFPISPSAVLVTIFSPDLIPASYSLATDLRSAGLNVTCYPEPVKLSRQFKFADRMGMRAVLVFGPDEAEAGTVTLKNLVNGTQETVSRGQVAASVKHILESR